MRLKSLCFTLLLFDVEPRRVVPLYVDALILPLGAVVVVVLELVQKRLGVVRGDVDARRLVHVDACHVAGSGMHAGLDVQLDEECSMMVYLCRRRCRRSVDLSGSVLMRTKWKKSG